jgi:hypothetical protein
MKEITIDVDKNNGKRLEDLEKQLMEIMKEVLTIVGEETGLDIYAMKALFIKACAEPNCGCGREDSVQIVFLPVDKPDYDKILDTVDASDKSKWH